MPENNVDLSCQLDNCGLLRKRLGEFASKLAGRSPHIFHDFYKTLKPKQGINLKSLGVVVTSLVTGIYWLTQAIAMASLSKLIPPIAFLLISSIS